MSVLESAPPRIHCAPADADYSWAEDEAVPWVLQFVGLFQWQQDVLRDWLGIRMSDGTWAAKRCAENMPRQNGKGEVLMARELVGMYLLAEPLVMHTAHEARTAHKHFERIEAVIRDNPELYQGLKRNRRGDVAIRYANGEWAISLANGSELEFATRTKNSGRGLTGDLLVLDEAMILSQTSHAATMPTLRARSIPSKTNPRGMQIVYAGSAVDQERMEHGLVWAQIRAQALAGDAKSFSYAEWSVALDHPSQMTEEMFFDEGVRRISNPSYGLMISAEQMDLEFQMLDLRSAAVELYGAGDYPSLDEMAGQIIRYDTWMSLVDPESAMEDPVCVAFDVSPERRSSIAAGGRRSDGLWHGEVIESKQGTRWLPRRLAELVERHDVVEVVCDGFGPAASMIEQIEEAGVKVTKTTSTDLGRACGLLVDAVDDKTLRHRGGVELADAIKGAKPRPLGDAWAWSRKNSSVDISPLVATTLALWSAQLNLDDGVVEVY